MKAAIVCVAAICVAQAGFAADETGQTQLTEMRARMARTLKSLPNYLCLQTTERLRASKVKAQAKAKRVDTVQLEVAHVGDKEMYSWPGRNMFADSQLQNALPNGLVGTGAYASQVIDILFGPGTQFRWVGQETLGQRATLRWDFTVAKAESNWTVFKGKRTSRVGSEGSIWADAGTLDLVRLEARATQFSARFPLKSVARNIDYATMRIGARDVLLPSVVEDLAEESDGPLDINRSRFGHCREYSTSSTLTFDGPAAQPAPEQPGASPAALPPIAQTPSGPVARLNVQPPPAPSALPPNTHIVLGLDAHLRPENAVMGAAVNAHVLSDIRYKGKLLAPKGTPVHGVLQQYIKVDDGFVYSFTLTIEFNEIELPGGARVPFQAWLKSIDTPVKGLWWLIPSDGDMMQSVHYSGPGAGADDDLAERVKGVAKPGVAVLIVKRQESFHLFPGTRMTWITSDDVPKSMTGR